jgi:hypothetical protein
MNIQSRGMSDRNVFADGRRPAPHVAPTATLDAGRVTPRELVAEHLAGSSTRVVGQGRRTLVLKGMTLATVGPDPSDITPVCAVSARDLPVTDVLAGLASQDPTGVLIIETSEEAFAFEVNQGRLCGARGVGALDQLEPFVAEVHRRHPQRFGADEEIGADQPAWMKVARAFVEERVLDQLTLGRKPGTRMTLIRGDIAWCGTRLPTGVGPTLGHVLLEHARRFDELPKLLESLGDLDRIAIPLAEPGIRPARPTASASSNDWDFFSDPDPAAMNEWNDAVAVFALCDGESSLREIVDIALLGEFRGLLALRTLASSRCIVLIDPLRHAKPSPETPAPAEETADVIPIRGVPEPFPQPESPQTGYSIVRRRVASRGPRQRVEVSPEPAPPRPPDPEPITEEMDPIPVASRSLVAAQALDHALPSPKSVMIVLGATGVLALVAAIAALV